MSTYTLTGRITNPQREPLAGLTVRAYGEAPKSPNNFLGEAVTKEDGRYTIRFAEAQFKPGGKESGEPDVYIRVFDGDEMLGESEVRRDVGRRVSISLPVNLPAPSEPDEPEEPAFSVSGVVRQSDGRPLIGIVVRAVDQGLRERRTELGQSNTTGDGGYTIAYDQDKLLDPERGSANLLVEVLGRDGASLVRSDVRFNARRNETVDLTADPDGQASEWDRIMARLQPALQEVAITDLTEKDLAFIAQSHRLDSRQLQPVVAAARTAVESRLPDWFHYALTRQGLPAELDAVLEVPDARIQQALADARKTNIIDPDEEELAALQQAFARMQANHLLDKSLPGHRLEARKMFDLAGLAQEQQQTLARALVGQARPAPGGSINIPEDSGLDDAALERLRFTLRLAWLVDDRESAIQELVQDERIHTVRDLARHFDPETWEQLLERTTTKDGQDLPDDLPGETSADQRAAYARQLHARAAAAYPTVAMAYGLARRAALADSHGVQLLPRMVEDDERFNLAAVRLDQYVKERRERLGLRTDEAVAAVTKELKRVQRLHRLKPDMSVVARLLEDNLDSATAIASEGKRRFVETYEKDPAVGRDTALAIYQSAERTATRALGVYAHYSPSINTSPRPAAIEECPAALKGVPNIPTLFGSLDGCECEPCESVYSPAAYLTDLLAFLERNVEKPKAVDWPVPDNGLEALAGRSYCNAANELTTRTRRPDIFLTLLSCRNAETEMPYVDLVLEILERAVAPDGSDEVYQTSLPDNQLAAQAEHFNEKAYATLGKASFPFSLPFDLWHEEETIYLNKLGTSRAELLETFYPFKPAAASAFPNGEPHDLTDIRRWQDMAIAQARLGLSDNAWKLISGQPIPPAQAIVAAEPWGYSLSPGGSPWWHPLRNADTLLTRSGLEYKELLRLLRLRSFNPTGSIGIADNSLGACDPKKINLKGLSTNVLGFLHRFLRLQRALGWSLREMDQALLSLAPPSSNNTRPALDETFLVRLSHLIRLREKFGLPLDELLNWWAPLDTRDYQVPQLPREKVSPSLYERLFLTGRAGEAEFEAFQLNAGRTELKSSNQLLNNHLPPIAGALRLALPDLQLLVGNLEAALVQNNQGQPRLTLANLSLLFRHAALARTLGLKIEEYLTLKILIPFDPFLTTPLTANDPLSGTLQTLRFVERVEAVRESGFSIAELDYLLRQAMPFTGKTVAPTAEWVRESLADIKKNLLSLPVAVSPIALFHEMLDLLETDSPSAVPLPDLRLLIGNALNVFEANGGDQSQEFQETQQLLQEAQELVSPDEPFTEAKHVKLRGKISEAVGYYKKIQRGLQTSALQTALAEILDLPAPVCKILLEHTPLPADSDQMAGEAFLNAWLSPPLDADGVNASTSVANGAGTGPTDGNNGNGSSVPTTPADGEKQLTELLYRLHKAALVIGRLGIQASELIDEEDGPRFLNISQASNWLNLIRPPVRDSDSPEPYDAWMRTVRLFKFRDVLLPEQQKYLFDLLKIAVEHQAGVTPFANEQRRKYYAKLALLSGWSENDLRAVIGHFDIGAISEGGGGILSAAFPQHFADERLPQRILVVVQLLKRLGVSAFEAEGWVAAPLVPVQHPGARVQQIKNALKARYGDGWADVLKPLRDPLRERQRQALLTYLLHEWNLERADDLFDHFLIDVEMSPCMMTSRLVQATASVQLFVQRVLMNLEPGLALSDEGAEQWEWMKNYRVWEANRKIFLYPENWIEPELRDDKTPFFKDLENELMQADITNDTAETALLHYLEKLHEVARLQICGQYLDVTANPITLHVFGRTRDVPHHYYYRRGLLEFDAEGLSGTNTNQTKAYAHSSETAFAANWTPWERLNVDIEGDHLIPVVYNRRVFLFWPIFTEKDDPAFSQLEQEVLRLIMFGYRLQALGFSLVSEIGGLVMSAGQWLFDNVAGTIVDQLNHIIKYLNELQIGLKQFSEWIGPTLQGIHTLISTVVSYINENGNNQAAFGNYFGNTFSEIQEPPTSNISLDKQLESIDEIIKKMWELINETFQPSDFIPTPVGPVGFAASKFLNLTPAKRIEIQMAWSEYKNDSWSAKKTSSGIVSFRDAITPLFETAPSIPGTAKPEASRLFTFSSELEDFGLTIRCQVALPVSAGLYKDGYIHAPKDIGSFTLNGCNGRLDASDLINNPSLPDALLDFLAVLSIFLQESANDALASIHGIPTFHRGEPRTLDDDPFRPSRLRFALDEFLPKRWLSKKSLFDNKPLEVEDIYRILARYQSWFPNSPLPVGIEEELRILGFFYQDAKRAFFCFPWNIPVNNPGNTSEDSRNSDRVLIFLPFYHPYTCALLENLKRFGVSGIYDVRFNENRQPDSNGRPLQLALKDDDYFGPPEYHPVNKVYNPSNGQRALRPIEEFNFSNIGAYAQYNWEIFFHIPLLIANRLSTNQEFRVAQHWFHYIFNPTDASPGSAPEKYWRTRPFVEQPKTAYAVQDIDELLLLLNSEAEIPNLQEIEWAVRRWRRDAFNPHLVARTRTVAFQKAVVMKYIDNLIAWGDSLFRRETRESVNEAMQLYILAAKLLGPRPRRIPKLLQREEKNFLHLWEDLDAFSNALVEFENHLSPTAAGPDLGSRWGVEGVLEDKNNLAGATLAPVGNAHRELLRSPSMRDVFRQPGEKGLYFCVPPNNKLLEKWDLVADRLFKIRYCQNIEGQALSLALLSPPIDPALLVRARAMGIDVDSVLSQLQSPLPHYRFQALAQKASELCGEVKALGSALLSALEKRDGEELALLRNTHELRMLNAVQAIKEQQIKEAKLNLEGLQHSKEATTIRRDHNLRLLMEFISPEELTSTALGAGSLVLQIAQFGVTWGASAASLIPNIKGGFVTTLGATYGGENVKGAAENAAQAMGILSSILSSTGGLISTMGGYRRRAEDWLLQITLAEKELDGLEKQIAAADIRVAVAEADLENHKLQIRNSQETQEFMQQKFTSQELYHWMVAQTSTLYFQSYQLAFHIAKKAQQTFAFELDLESPDIIRYGYWNSLKNGLLAGEHLHHDLKRLDVAYMDENKREYELTKTISLSALDPLELIKLREIGKAEFSLPETLFDMDFPGHYMRRIKSVSLSIPCVTGPYSGVHATLRLEKSRIRCKPDSSGNYAPDDDNVSRFCTLHTATRVMATSTGQNDSGLFELNFRDERYLPFEGEGVESRWSLSINKEFAQFDLDTISDVILHVRYTARDGGEALKGVALQSLRDVQDALTTIDGEPLSLTRLFSIRHEFPDEWARLQAQTPVDGQTFELTLDLRKEHYPFWSQGRLKSVKGIDILARSTESKIVAGGNALAQDPSFGELHFGKMDDNALPTKPIGELKLSFNTATLSDLWVAVSWRSV